MKPIRTVKIETVEDIDALPEGEWVHVPGGIRANWVFEDEDDEPLEITLPARVARKLKARQGTRFQATLRGRKLLLRK